MSTRANPSGPTATTTSTNPSGGVPLPPTPTQLQTALDSGIWYSLSLWPALHVAVSNSWGGPSSSDKRDWFAGAISDLLASNQSTDQEDLEVFLLQVMQDEFDCNVEDESEEVVAREIFRLRKNLKGELEVNGTVVEDRMQVARELGQRFKGRGQMKGSIQVQVIDNGPQEEVGDDEDWDDDGEDEDGDVDMDAEEGAVPHVRPTTVQQPPKERERPEVDDDGFTKVKGKKRTG